MATIIIIVNKFYICLSIKVDTVKLSAVIMFHVHSINTIISRLYMSFQNIEKVITDTICKFVNMQRNLAVIFFSLLSYTDSFQKQSHIFTLYCRDMFFIMLPGCLATRQPGRSQGLGIITCEFWIF